jgi:hypothetical protein
LATRNLQQQLDAVPTDGDGMDRWRHQDLREGLRAGVLWLQGRLAGPAPGAVIGWVHDHPQHDHVSPLPIVEAALEKAQREAEPHRQRLASALAQWQTLREPTPGDARVRG